MLLSQTSKAPNVSASWIIMGSTQLAHKHWITGGVFFAIQCLFIFYLPDLTTALKGLISLGDVAQTRQGFKVIQGITPYLCWWKGLLPYCSSSWLSSLT